MPATFRRRLTSRNERPRTPAEAEDQGARRRAAVRPVRPDVSAVDQAQDAVRAVFRRRRWRGLGGLIRRRVIWGLPIRVRNE